MCRTQAAQIRSNVVSSHLQTTITDGSSSCGSTVGDDMTTITFVLTFNLLLVVFGWARGTPGLWRVFGTKYACLEPWPIEVNSGFSTWRCDSQDYTTQNQNPWAYCSKGKYVSQTFIFYNIIPMEAPSYCWYVHPSVEITIASERKELQNFDKSLYYPYAGWYWKLPIGPQDLVPPIEVKSVYWGLRRMESSIHIKFITSACMLSLNVTTKNYLDRSTWPWKLL